MALFARRRILGVSRFGVFLVALPTLVETQPGPGSCYYPSGSLAVDQKPCDGSAYTSFCCPIGWTCFSNAVCVVTDLSEVSSNIPLGTTSRGSCTNPSWDYGQCGGFCLDTDDGALRSCGGGSFCCESDARSGGCSCASGRGTFVIPSGEAQTITRVSGTPISTSSTFPSSKSTAAPSTTDSTTSKTSNEPTTKNSRTSRTKNAPSSTDTSNTSTEGSTSQSSGPSSSTSAAVASGTSTSIPIVQTTRFKASIGAVSAVIGLVLLGVGGYLLFRRRKRKQESRTAADHDDDDSEFLRMQERQIPPQLPRLSPEPREPLWQVRDFIMRGATLGQTHGAGNGRSKFSNPQVGASYRPPVPYEGT